MCRPGLLWGGREASPRGMHPLRTAPDFYDVSALQQMAAATALLVFITVLGFIALHLVRRGFRTPVASEGTKVAAGLRLRKYELGARLYHWANAVLLAALAVSGLALYRPGILAAAPWLLIHEVSATLFAAALLLHIVVAPQRGSGRAMWFESRDWRDMKLILANFFGRTNDYPACGKYDPWQKIYHAFLTIASGAVIFSGIYLIASAEVWRTFSHQWLRSMRVLHDIGATAFIAVIVGHIYFGVIRVNWPQLIAMFTGHLRGSSFNRYHDAARWTPPATNPNVIKMPAKDRLSRAAD